ncbi:E3 ubiquitin-protein ligase RBBP6 [Morella rubra]|uniref:E3 ubiquitin-protein ligase RBBP6 n=1 Tax=Morella rubra TaxID=262757 RepID=A0A6A1W4V8_9ROSI|nr:E3 ubiquitin-protein ligase RBBP6 [Morella rubra]
MAVRFKFRSSANFNSVDIDGTAISVRELKSKIARDKNLDLLLSDALTGQEYTDDKFQIPSCSSVIIRRVPAGLVASKMADFNALENVQRKDPRTINSTLPLSGNLRRLTGRDVDASSHYQQQENVCLLHDDLGINALSLFSGYFIAYSCNCVM